MLEQAPDLGGNEEMSERPWGKSIAFSVGRYGGFNAKRLPGHYFRLCLGFVSIIWFSYELEDLITDSCKTIRKLKAAQSTEGGKP